MAAVLTFISNAANAARGVDVIISTTVLVLLVFIVLVGVIIGVGIYKMMSPLLSPPVLLLLASGLD